MKYGLIVFIALFFSVKALAADQIISAHKIFSSDYVSAGDFSNDGKYVLIVTNDDEDRHLNVVNTSSNELTSILDIGENGTLRRFQWLDNKRVYISLRKRGKITEYIVDISDNEGSIKSTVTDIPTKGFIVNTLNSAPNYVLYARRKEYREPSYELVHIKIDDLVNGKFKAGIEYGKPSGRVTGFFYDGYTNNIAATIAPEGGDVVTIKYRKLRTTKWKKLLTYERGDYTFRPINFISERRLAVLTNKNSDKVALYEYDLDTQSIVREIYTHPKYDLTGATMLPDGKGVEKVTFLEQGKYTNHYLISNVDIDRDMVSRALPDKQWLVASQHKSKKMSLIRSFGSNTPGELYLYRAGKNELTEISTIMPQLDGYKFPSNQQLTITLADNTEIEAFLTTPSQHDTNVLLVMPHGGPIGIRDRDYFSRDIQFLANRGFSVLRVNYRGSGGFGKAFRESGVGQFGKQIESDITAAVVHVTSLNHYDKVCSIGSSYGGYSALMLPIQNPDTYDCAVAKYGIFDLPFLFNSSNLKQLDGYQEAIEGIVGENNKTLFDVSPAYRANEINIPVLLIGGREDSVADFEHTHRMYYMLNKYHKDVETLFYSNIGHGQHEWEGMMHESAYIVDYLYRVLGLPHLYTSKLTASDEKSLIDDYNRLADSFTFKSNLEINKPKAFSLYKISAELGHKRATYNVGSYYEQGEIVPKDMSKAIEWYQKSANMGYGRAYHRLGNIYLEGLGVDQDKTLAMSFFAKAKDNKATADVVVKMADAYCHGEGVSKDIKHCFELMRLSSLKGQNRITNYALNARDETLAKVFLNNDHNPIVKEEFKRFLVDEYGAENVTIKSVKKAPKSQQEQVFVIHNGGFIQDDKSTKIGGSFKVKTLEDKRNKGPKPAYFAYRWLKKDADGNASVVHQTILKSTSGLLHITRKLFEDELEPATWTLEIYDVEGNIHINKDYHVKMKKA